jgi:hypothetical protein
MIFCRDIMALKVTSIGSTILKWQTFRLLRWMKKLASVNVGP